MWGFPPITEEFVKRWTITRNRSGNYHYQTPCGRKYTSRDAVRDLLNDMQKGGLFEPGWVLPWLLCLICPTQSFPILAISTLGDSLVAVCHILL
jgi:hypothetical protein